MTTRPEAPRSLPDDQMSAALQRAKSRLEDMRDRLGEPLAVIGIGCRFPQASGPGEFWEFLRQGRCAVAETPAERWPSSLRAGTFKESGKITANRGAFLAGIDQFDTAFFAITRREALTLDPQQRLLLEVAWEALEDGGLDPTRLRGSRTGVFVGICSNDYLYRLARREHHEIDAYLGTGNAHGAAAGRLSYFMNWIGPSVAVDTACSSSLTAVHLAVRSLRAGDCDMALVAGVNVILAPELSITLSQTGMLSPTGLCRTFDASADGFVRGEGCGVVLLKRLSRALADGDRIMCVVRGSATNQDGRSNGLTAPSGVSQQAVIHAALTDARLTPDRIDYVETHGTGTELGDPIEMGALQSVFAQARDAAHPLRVGSVKTNIGHLEGAAGIAGLIKVVLSLKNEQLPPHLHFVKPSSHIDWTWPVEVNTELTDWRSGGSSRVAGVSSFGFGGSNAHVVLEEAPPGEPAYVANRPSSRARLLTISARSEAALQRQVQSYLEILPGIHSLDDLCRTSNAGRAHFDHRVAISAKTMDEAGYRLSRCQAAGKELGIFTSAASLKGPVYWFFPDLPGGRFGAGRRLYETHPRFRAEIDRCEQVLSSQWPCSLKSILWEDERLGHGPDALPAGFCLQIAAANMWLSWGICPSLVVGHGAGEYAAACVAGVFSLDDAVKLVTRRAMRAVGGVPDRAEVRDSEVDECIIYHPGRYRYASTCVDGISTHSLMSAEYWAQLRTDDASGSKRAAMPPERVFMRTGSNQADELSLASPAENALWLEMGATAKDRQVFSNTAAWLPGLTADETEWEMVIANLARLYVAGAAVNWGDVEDPKGPRISLPTYPFERSRIWCDDEQSSSGEMSILSRKCHHPLLDQQLDLAAREIVFQSDLSRHEYLSDHQLHSMITFPAAGFLELAMAAGRDLGAGDMDVVELTIHRPLIWHEGERCVIQTVLTPLADGWACRIARREGNQWWTSAEWQLVRTEGDGTTGAALSDREQAEEMAIETHYERCRQGGLYYGPAFRGLQRLFAGNNEAWGAVELPGGIDSTDSLLHPALLDACLQVTAGALGSHLEGGWLPSRIGRYRLKRSPPADARLNVHARVQATADNYSVDLAITDGEGRPVASIESLVLKPIRRNAPTSRPVASTRRKGSQPVSAHDVLQASPDAGREMLQTYLHARFAQIMEMSVDEIPLDKPLINLGIDSLMAFELGQEIEQNLHVTVPVELFLQNLSLVDFTSLLLQQLEQVKGIDGDRQTNAANSDRSPAEGSWTEGAI